ncbi:hypothetical protein GGS21DRAFT_204800 [Xylaria nigripes]|nr:hypothetical protein GGS21DRAFT_204800 [Xylaria nigripes]
MFDRLIATLHMDVFVLAGIFASLSAMKERERGSLERAFLLSAFCLPTHSCGMRICCFEFGSQHLDGFSSESLRVCSEISHSGM